MAPSLKRQRLEASESQQEQEPHSRSNSPKRKKPCPRPAVISSPFQLTWIQDLPDELNQDAVTLQDLVGDPLIKECWNFNYMHDIPFLMDAFDRDVRGLVKVHIIHGYWKREDPGRLMIELGAENFPNVSHHAAPMPEMFGTHHSKMMILLRHDDAAQVIIHTANTIPHDWTNMTNGVWKSPLLPLLPRPPGDQQTQNEDSDDASAPSGPRPIGTGKRFKQDLLRYLGAYNARKAITQPLVEELEKYDFSSIRAALIASTPGRHGTNWGWRALKKALEVVPVRADESTVVAQMSSIATLGPRPTWLQDTLFKAMSASKTKPSPQPNFRVVFPTVDEIHRSLAGYMSGASIHCKIQSKQQAKQLDYMRNMYYHWANDSPNGKDLGQAEVKNSGRNRAAPHIKTYIRYGKESIDWALLTSANLSKQAWGEAVNSAGEMRISSWEIGVLVWPELLAEDKDAIMVETLQKDTPSRRASDDDRRPMVGLRVPYSLPLQKYGHSEIPWVATLPHAEPDCKGRKWAV